MNYPSAQRQVQRRRLEDQIAELRTVPLGSRRLRAGALDARRQAAKLGDQLLEAEALLLPCRRLTPTYSPSEALEGLREGEAIFSANRLPGRALAARAGIAFVQCELGQERLAIDTAQAVLAQPALLAADDAAAAVYAMALAQARLGELDAALGLLDGRAAEWAKAGSAANPVLPARLAWARANVLCKAVVCRTRPALWRGPPLDAGLVQWPAVLPEAGAVLQMFEDARRLLPPGHAWPYGELPGLALCALEGGPVQTQAAACALQALAETHWAEDPPVAAAALLHAASVYLAVARPREALAVVLRARGPADERQLDGLRRDLLLFEVQAREALADSAGALAALKLLKVLRIRSIAAAVAPALPVPRPPLPADPAAVPPRRFGAAYNLEPSHVRRALRFIDEHIRERISVQAVAEHAGVSRRTLETAFRAARSCTVAEHIRLSKLRSAAEELLLTSASVQGVAEAFGFASVSTFSRRFSAHYGTPPSVWVRRQQAGESTPDPASR